MSQAVPLLEIDLFSSASLRYPYPDYCRLRDAGPLVRLAQPEVFAIARFDDVQAALRASDVLISGEGVGFSDTFNAPKGMNVLQTDGDLHRRMRATVTRPLSPATLKAARADFKGIMAARVAALTGRGWFDAMKELAAFLPVEAVSHLVGLPRGGRERMLEWAAAAFNVIGPNQDPADVTKMREAFAYMATLDEEAVSSDSWAAQLFAAARNGKLSQK